LIQHCVSEVGPRARLFCFSKAIRFVQDRPYLLIAKRLFLISSSLTK